MKKTVILAGLLLCAALLFGGGKAESGKESGPALQVAASGFPIVPEQVTLKMVGSRAANQADWNEMEIWKYYEEKTNVHVEWTTVPDASREERKQLMFASGDIPDAFYGMYLTAQEEIQYGSQGVLIPLEDLYKEYAPSVEAYLNSDTALRKTYTAPDGHIYTFPSGTDRTVFLNTYTTINTAWLDKLGLEMPETIDDYYDVLVAFRNGDPNGNGKKDEIPLSLQYNGTTLDIFELGQWFGIPSVKTNKVFVDDDGTVVYAPVDPRFKAMIEWFRKAREAELLDPEMFTQDWQKIDAKGQDESAELLGGFMRSTIAWTVGFDRTPDYEILPALVNPRGTKMVTGKTVNSKGRFSVTSANPYPEATVRWIDYFATVEGSMDIQMGPQGKYWSWNGDGSWSKLNPEKQATNESVTPKNGTYVPYINYDSINTSKRLDAGQVDWQAKVYAGIDEGLHPFRRVPFPDAYMTVDQVRDISSIETDISAYVEQSLARFINGDLAMSEWDGYVATVNKMGVEKLIAVYQEVYDSFNK